MNLDKLYDQILARKETRESSTLTMVTMASSASLILFVFVMGENIEDSLLHLLIPILGILFPLVAIAYREISFYYIQAHDNTILNAILLKELKVTNEEKNEINNVIKYKNGTRAKKFLGRLLMGLPIFGWILYLDYLVGSIVI